MMGLRMMALRACLLLASAWLGICGLAGLRTVQARSGGILLAAAEETDALCGSTAEAMRQQEEESGEGIGFTAWSQRKERVMAYDGCREIETNVVTICGSSEYLIPYGRILQEWDREGCLIGGKTAETLFGSRDVSGLTVSCAGRDYVVRGVLSSPEELLVIAGTDDSTVYDHITLERQEGSGRLAAEKFLVRHGLSMQRVNRAGFENTFSLSELWPGSWADFAGVKQNFTEWRESVRSQEKIAESVFETAAREQETEAAFLLAAGILLFAAAALTGTGKRSK